MQIDIFNGDADGICALLQLRLAKPCNSKLITSFKRDIKLLAKIDATQGDQLTVLDISLEKNHTDLLRLLNQGAEVFYVDHHRAGTIPSHPKLTTLINTDANVCSSLLVNQYLKGQYYQWAIVGGFGDNMNQDVIQIINNGTLKPIALEQLKILGVCLNYNGYGTCIDDLHFAPDVLYRKLENFKSPFDFINNDTETYQKLVMGYENDMANAANIRADYSTDHIAVYKLPDTFWARRISGVFANELANKFPDRAHAIVSHNNQQGYQISVRAPLNNKTKADELCSAFPTGGGRKGAAGINHLDENDLSGFIQLFEKTYC
jgi:oligoribonuclease NrnB/cAMP/cGMP phosphodiesterase (DHH superfamily)